MFSVSEVSLNDRKRKIRIPSSLSPELAEVIGIIIGDGYVVCGRSYKKEYVVNVSGCMDDYRLYFIPFVIPLFKKLFNIAPCIKLRRKDEAELQFSSKSLAHLFSKSFGIPQQKTFVRIPDFIMSTKDSEIKASVLRGLFDTDGFIGFRKKHRLVQYYPTIGFASASQLLAEQVGQLLTDFGFHFTLYKNTAFHKEYRKYYTTYKIDLNGKENMYHWMSVIGFSNGKNNLKFNNWKRKNGPGEN